MIKSIIALCEEELLDTIILPSSPMAPTSIHKERARKRKEELSLDYKDLKMKYFWDYGDLELRIYGTKK